MTLLQLKAMIRSRADKWRIPLTESKIKRIVRDLEFFVTKNPTRFSGTLTDDEIGFRVNGKIFWHREKLNEKKAGN